MSSTGPHTVEPETESLSPIRRRFTVDEYHRMIAAGILGEGEHVELLEGEILEMSPQDERHFRPIQRLTRWLNLSLGDDFQVRPQGPLTLGESEPEPDVAVVRSKDAGSARAHPGTALLVVEVSNVSVRYDLDVKSRIYATADIPEYWLVVVGKRSVEVFRDPEPKLGIYKTRITLGEDETLTPIAFPGPIVSVASLFE